MVLFFSCCLDNLELGLTDADFNIIDSASHKFPRKHSEYMVPTIKKFLKTNNKITLDITDIYFTNGPGGFTGNRLGVIFVKSLLILKPSIKVYTIDTLSSLTADETGVVSIAAQSGQFFTAQFKGGKLTGSIKVSDSNKNNIVQNNNVINNMVKKRNHFNPVGNFDGINTIYVKEI